MVISSVDKMIEQLTNQTDKTTEVSFWKVGLTADSTGVPTFMWRALGQPSDGAVPATGVGTIPTKDTAGAIFLRNAGAGENSYITDFSLGGASFGTYLLVDVLWFNSGLSGTVTTAQTINSTALTRYTGADAVGNMLALICWTATGSTASNVTTSYTNSAGTSGRTSASVALWTGGFGGGTLAPTADEIQILPFQDGDSGIRSIESLTLSASTLTAGNFGAMIFRPLLITSYITNKLTSRTATLLTPTLPEKLDDACLALIGIPSAAATGIVYGNISVVEG